MASTIANIGAAFGGSDKTFSPWDFVPGYERPKKSAQEIFDAMAAAFGAATGQEFTP